MLYFKIVFCEEKYSIVKKYYNKVVWCLLLIGFFLCLGGWGVIMCNLFFGDMYIGKWLKNIKYLRLKFLFLYI